MGKRDLRGLYYCVELRVEYAFVREDEDYYYEGLGDRLKTNSVLVYKKTEFTQSQIDEIECELQSKTMWQFTSIVGRYMMDECPRSDIFIREVWQYGDYIREARKYKRAIERERRIEQAGKIVK